MKKKNKMKNTLTSQAPNQMDVEDFWLQGTTAEASRPIVAIRLRSKETKIYTPSKGWFSSDSYKTIKTEPVLEIKREGDEEWTEVYKNKEYSFVDLGQVL